MATPEAGGAFATAGAVGRNSRDAERRGVMEFGSDGSSSSVNFENGTVLDVVENPKQIKLVELEAAQLPRSLDDVDLAIINTTYASQIDLLPTRDGLFVEDKDSPYVNLVVARENNKDAQKVKQFVQAYQSEEVFKAAQELFHGGVVKGW